jgi:hypothetical protein
MTRFVYFSMSQQRVTHILTESISAGQANAQTRTTHTHTHTHTCRHKHTHTHVDRRMHRIPTSDISPAGREAWKLAVSHIHESIHSS